ncbi:papain family cysteine protease [Necator americanus]|uniref:Papain family cysteine protease n=1 Tax=Necator americanus TaxID=51031 RepID=W2SGE7_NECAM|nr:papain family cysteine protease [Necator americanus]ETN68699.1 papain family cysteine protease [Necator americanus]
MQAVDCNVGCKLFCVEQLSCDVKTAIPTTSSPPTGTTSRPTSPSTIVAAEYLQKKGATSEAEYSFVGKESSTCQLSSAAVIPRMKSFDSGYVSALNDSAYALLNTALEERVRKGPVAVGMAVNSNIYSYSEGIFDGECGTTINHAVVIVGFTPQYWIVRNSWGSSWGEAGHIRILRQPTDPCKLTRYWSQPIATATWTQGNAVVVPPMQSTTSVPNLQGCCDGACCEECTCDDDDDDEYTISGMEKPRATTVTTEITVPKLVTIQEITTSTSRNKPRRDPRKYWG